MENANMEDDIFWMIIHGQEITPRLKLSDGGKKSEEKSQSCKCKAVEGE